MILTLKSIIDDYTKIYMNMLTEKQRDFVIDESRFKILQGVRQCGKSHIIKIIAFLTAIYEPNKTIAIVSYDLKSSRMVLHDINQLYKKLNLNYKPKVEVSNTDHIDFDNGSRIIVSTCNSNSLRRFAVNLLLFDEIAFADENEVSMLWGANFPNISSHGKIIIVSSRKNRSKKNFFWRIWLGAVCGTNKFKPFKLTSKDAGFTKLKLKNIRNSLSNKEYDKQYIIRNK